MRRRAAPIPAVEPGPRIGPTIEQQIEGLPLLRDTFDRLVADQRRAGQGLGATPAERKFLKPVLETPTRDIRGMVREDGSIETQRAAVDIKKDCAWLRWRLLQILATQGPRTARDLENRAEFSGFGPSSVRKRITELKQAGQVHAVGREDKMALWGIVPTDTPTR